MIKTTYGEMDISIDAIVEVQSLNIPFESVLDISDALVIVEEKLKSYKKSALAIEQKYYPKDDEGNTIYANKEKTIIKPTDPKTFKEEIKKLNETEVEIEELKPIVIKVTPELLKQNFKVEYINAIKWLITFKR